MGQPRSYDAIVIGSGPNGLAAAIELARAGRSVLVCEAEDTIGGGARSAELTLPGFVHDVCSAIHSLAVASPFFRTIPLEHHGLEWIHPPAPLAHPFDDGTAAVLERSIDQTSETLGGDAGAYRNLMEPLAASWERLESALLGPMRWPRHPVALARFGVRALRSANGLAKRLFKGERARGLFAGLAAHSMLPLEQIVTAAFGLVLGITGHTVGWPVPRGGAQRITDSLASYLRSLGGEIVTGMRVESIDELPPAQLVLCDVTPRQLLRIVGHRLPDGYRRKLARYRYGSAAFKMDWALDGPIPGRLLSAHARAQCIWAILSRRLLLPSACRRKPSIPKGLLYSSRNRVCSIRRARPRESTRRGLTAMFHHQRRPAVGFMACAVSSPPAQPCVTGCEWLEAADGADWPEVCQIVK